MSLGTSRRYAVIGAASVLAVAIGGFLGWRTYLVPKPSKYGVKVTRFTVSSSLLHRSFEVIGVTPPGAATAKRPLLILLHGRGGSPEGFLSDQLFSALSAQGPRAPVVAMPPGGDASYWHDRADGPWGSYVVQEVIPAAAGALGADPTRVAIGGFSMGGFGALDLARLNPGRFCAAGGHSAALWLTSSESAVGAFDNLDDFAKHDLIAAAHANPAMFGSSKVWIDVGTADPFLAADATLVGELLRRHGPVSFQTWPGTHDDRYFRSHLRDYMAFYASGLASCR